MFERLGLESEEIEEIMEKYEDDFLETIFENEELVLKNYNIMNKYFDIVNEIFLYYLPIFLYDTGELEIKIKKLIDNIGDNYQKEIENDMGLLGELV